MKLGMIGLGRMGGNMVERLEENLEAQRIELTTEDLERIEEAAPKGAASGERYSDMGIIEQ
jgi:6-phosphogluconate dehydrogenase (decarboxylating)